MLMEATPTNPFAWLLLPVAMVLARRSVMQDLDGVQAWCESAGEGI
jgi:hypothetical protein